VAAGLSPGQARLGDAVLVLMCALTARPLIAQGSPVAADRFAAARAAFDRYELKVALPLFRQAAAEAPSAERYAWVGETARRLGQPDDAVAAARTALTMNPCSSFAHVVLADTYNPQYTDWNGAAADSVWPHLKAAAACDPADGNVGFALWIAAQQRGDGGQAREALDRLMRTGLLPGPALTYARWLLRLAPDRAVVITGGDLDTYPAAAVQALEGLRPDVAVVNLPMLNLPWYVRLVAQRDGLPLPLPADSLAGDLPQTDLATIALRVWRLRAVAGTLGRPLTFAISAGSQPVAADLGGLRIEGPVFRVVSGPDEFDTSAADRALHAADSMAWRGPVVSPFDRSPLRRTSTHPATTVLFLAMASGMSALERADLAAASTWLAWGRRFGREQGLPPAETDSQLQTLIEAIADH
jgi:tetratricopeptide (TPR) repeat protein